jgi:hypothetical protein
MGLAGEKVKQWHLDNYFYLTKSGFTDSGGKAKIRAVSGPGSNLTSGLGAFTI